MVEFLSPMRLSPNTHNLISVSHLGINLGKQLESGGEVWEGQMVRIAVTKAKNLLFIQLSKKGNFTVKKLRSGQTIGTKGLMRDLAARGFPAGRYRAAYDAESKTITVFANHQGGGTDASTV
jgi:hypothetical protein